MRSEKIRQLVTILHAVGLFGCWALVILVACHVSTIVLDTLNVIVELAAISPD